MYQEVRNMNELSHLQQHLSENLFAAVSEVTKIYETYYSSQGIDGGAVIIIKDLDDLEAFLKAHPGVDIVNIEYVDVIEDEGHLFLNLAILAGTEYQFSIFLPRAILRPDQLEKIMSMEGLN